jgi:probable phosphoglycerate mutase
MKLLIIRHGDPDYAIDGLTEKGKVEAELLASGLIKEDIKAVYCSTMGRARLTAEPFLSKSGMTAEYCEWLREFNYPRIHVPYLEKDKNAWDLMPEFVDANPELYHPTLWREVDCLKGTEVIEAYDTVCREFDALLARHGYDRDKLSYKAVSPSHDTIAIFCHFGVTAILLAHIMNCSPYSVWQHCFTAPTAVTTVYTEERAKGIASLRLSTMGDVSHLYAADEPPSFSGRFCECFTDDTRH